jgi:hypothetical protein
MSDPHLPAGASPRLDVEALEARLRERYNAEFGPHDPQASADVLARCLLETEAENERLRAELTDLRSERDDTDRYLAGRTRELAALRASLAGIRAEMERLNPCECLKPAPLQWGAKCRKCHRFTVEPAVLSDLGEETHREKASRLSREKASLREAIAAQASALARLEEDHA